MKLRDYIYHDVFPSLIGSSKTEKKKLEEALQVMFPSLIGSSKTKGKEIKEKERERFPSLIGSSKTIWSLDGSRNTIIVSIPHRKFKNARNCSVNESILVCFHPS